ncbi:MAG TPA: ribosome maturation factor RimP [Longimicrobiales bacterium]|nr:ribosome maturation factor RimP [Longimicrobiales bacterium]
MRVVPEIAAELEHRVEDLGYELIEVRWGGSGRRPQLKLRIDRPDSTPGAGVTVEECAHVSRALEPWLDEHESLPERYVLEVSSPGVDRPLVRTRDFERFRGERVAVIGRDLLLGRSTRLEGELLGLQDEGSEAEAVRLRLPDGDEVGVPRSQIRKTHLVFEWK